MDQKRIGEFIAEKRKANGLTQQALAEKLFVSKQAVSKWERGICLPDIELIVPLSKILDVNINQLLMSESEPEPFADSSVIDVIQLYNEETKKKERRKTILISSALCLLVLIIILVPLFSKYSASKYDAAAQDAWVKTSTAIINTLDACAEFKDNDWTIDGKTFYQLLSSSNESEELLLNFIEKTKKGETVNSLAAEAEIQMRESLEGIIRNAEKELSLEQTYLLSDSEKEQIESLFKSLPKIHDSIIKEMRVSSPGISHLY